MMRYVRDPTWKEKFEKALLGHLAAGLITEHVYYLPEIPALKEGNDLVMTSADDFLKWVEKSLMEVLLPN